MLAAPIAALAIGLGACGGDEGSGAGDQSEAGSGAGAYDSPSPDETEAAPGASAVTIADFKFDPETLTVEAGTQVVWANEDSADHTASAEDGSFDTGTFGKGEEGRAVLDQPGTYSYICDLHPFMKGEVVVE